MKIEFESDIEKLGKISFKLELCESFEQHLTDVDNPVLTILQEKKGSSINEFKEDLETSISGLLSIIAAIWFAPSLIPDAMQLLSSVMINFAELLKLMVAEEQKKFDAEQN